MSVFVRMRGHAHDESHNQIEEKLREESLIMKRELNELPNYKVPLCIVNYGAISYSS